MLIKSFSDDWKWWIWNHVKLNQNKGHLFNILLNNGFEYDLIRHELNHEPEDVITRSRRGTQLALEEEPKVGIPSPYKALSDNPRARRIENVNLEIYEIDDFLSDKECSAMIEKIDPICAPSTVTNPEADKQVRTSETAYMRLNDPFIADINMKIHEFMRIPLTYAEEPQGQRYEVGQEFKQHCDWFDRDSPYNQAHLTMGQRTFTFMIYLNDVEEGGETAFTRINHEIKPKKGKALVWYNMTADGKGNFWSEHWGKPVIKGLKYIVTKWFREHDGQQKPTTNSSS
jgi:prolyl 4-hydroxylase